MSKDNLHFESGDIIRFLEDIKAIETFPDEFSQYKTIPKGTTAIVVSESRHLTIVEVLECPQEEIKKICSFEIMDQLALGSVELAGRGNTKLPKFERDEETYRRFQKAGFSWTKLKDLKNITSEGLLELAKLK